MSTRAIYTFADKEGEWTQGPFHVYVHHDGYPTGAADKLIKALAYAWPLPRYEADEFAAAFVAANKSHYIHEELELMRKLTGEAKIPAKERKELVERLVRTRDYAAQGYNGGGVRLLPSGDWKDVASHDIAYRYVVAPKPGNGQLLVFAYAVNFGGDSSRYAQDPLESERGWHERQLFISPLKSGDTLRTKAAACEAE